MSQSPPSNESWDAIDVKVNRLSSRAAVWGAMLPSQRLKYLVRARKACQFEVPHYEWGLESAQLECWDPHRPEAQRVAAFEAGVGGLAIKLHLEALIASYEEMVKGGDSYDAPRSRKLVSCVSRGTDGRAKLQLDLGILKSMLQMTAELHFASGADPTKDKGRAVNEYQGKLCLTLGAGNQNFLTAGDALHKLFVEGQVVLIKHHPLREFSRAPMRTLLAGLFDDGFVDDVCCDLASASRLILDARVNTLHMTGGKATHDAILANLRASGVGDKYFSSELGNVTPWIVCSGGKAWSEAELQCGVNALLPSVIN
jgi:hypothetical protein